MNALRLLIALGALLALNAQAITSPRGAGSDPRIRVMSYNPNEVFKYVGYYSYQSSIELEEGEAVETISMGDTGSWQITPIGRRIFLKPIGLDATTNMTLITNKRIYLFELHAREASSINDPGLSFVVKFLYPSTSLNTRAISASDPDLKKDASAHNFRYSMSGSSKIEPIKVFDDGIFTYFEFPPHTPLPAFFEVDRENKEHLLNYQVSSKYVIVESVASRFTLRYGADVLCVFNEATV